MTAGHEALWLWFGLSRAGFCVLPRAFMHEMPDDWQRRMAELLNEWDEAWNWPDDMPGPVVNARKGNRFASWPDVVTQYRHPLTNEIRAMRRSVQPQLVSE